MLDALLRGVGMFLDNEARQDTIAAQRENTAANMRAQMEMARHGIKMRVEDAKEAGIHPLYALGAPTMSWSPVSVGSAPETSFAKDFGSMGQDITRAMTANMPRADRAGAVEKVLAQQELTGNKLKLENMQLQNTLLRSKIALVDQPGTPPGVPFSVGEGKKEDNPPLMIAGDRVTDDPGWSPTKAVADRWGDESFATNAYGNIRAVRDLWRTYSPGMWMRRDADRSSMQDWTRRNLAPSRDPRYRGYSNR